jgi:hypothetical protein
MIETSKTQIRDQNRAVTTNNNQPNSEVAVSLCSKLDTLLGSGPSYFGKFFALGIHIAASPGVETTKGAISDLRLVDANASANQDGYR